MAESDTTPSTTLSTHDQAKETGSSATSPYKGASPRQLFWLKMLVGGLAAMIFLSMILIIGRVLYLVSKPKAAVGSDQVKTIALPDGAQIGAVTATRTRLTISYSTGDGQFVDVRDPEDGTLLHRFQIKSQP